MRRIIVGMAAVSVAAGSAAAGYLAARGELGWTHFAAASRLQATGSALQADERPILYYRHPERPIYSHEPQRTEDGRDFRAVRSGEDIEPEDDAARPRSTVHHASHGAAAREASGQRRILYYRNPMGLPDISPTPRRDSMGMDYIPVYEGEETEAGTVRVPVGRLQMTGVRSEPVVRRSVVREIRAPGLVQLDERRVTVVTLRAEAFVERVEAITTGEYVRQGQPLLRLYSPEVSAAGAQHAAALSFPGGATSATSGGARRRLENLAVPSTVIEEIERTRRPPLSFTLTAPRDGIVLQRSVSDGMRAAPGETLFRLADISLVWVTVDVPERELGLVRPGQAAEVRPRGLPGQSFSGRVVLVYPQMNIETRTARLRIELANPQGVLIPGMFAEVTIAAGGDESVLSVPDSAVIDSGTRQVVLLDRGEGRFEPREVRLGRRGSGLVEVREGVADGDRVVVSANFLIDAESNLRAALQGLAAGAASTGEAR